MSRNTFYTEPDDIVDKSRNTSPEFCADTLARGFAKTLKDGGKKFMIGWHIGKYGGNLCGDAYGFVLWVQDFHHKEKAFWQNDNLYLILRSNRPEARHGKAEEVKAVKRRLGFKAFRMEGSGNISEKAVFEFCYRHASWITKLKFRKTEDVKIFPDSILFRWVERDPEKLRPRLEAFFHWIDEMAGIPGPEIVPPLMFEREWRLKRLPKSNVTTKAARHRFGGLLEPPVACSECEEATNLVAQIDLADPSLPKTRLGRIKLPVFSCLACLGWGPAFYDVSGMKPVPLDGKGRAIKRKQLLPNEEDLSPRPLGISLVPKGAKTGRISRIGGKPAWLQGEETPACPKCSKLMAFAVQIASNSEIMFEDAGMLYTFACPKCKIIASLIQSH